MKTKTNNFQIGRFLVNWGAIVAMVMAFVIFSVTAPQAFFSWANMVTILRSISITTVIALGAVFTALAYFLYYRALDQLPMQTVSVCAYAEPLTAVVLGALALGEVMTPVQLAGACCIIGGALLGEARVKLPAAQRRRMRRAYVRLVRAQRHVLHHAA